MTAENELERNVGYVIRILEDNKGSCGLSIGDLTIGVRLKHSRENPLSLPEAKEAIGEAEKRRLIKMHNYYILGERYILNR